HIPALPDDTAVREMRLRHAADDPGVQAQPALRRRVGGRSMQGDRAVIQRLNEVLTNELTSVNQYFMHERMLENWGLNRLGKLIYEESIGEMRHADKLI